MISSLVAAVDTGIMPTQGGAVAAGLERAAMLLEQTGLRQGDVLLITDSEVTDQDLDAAGELASDGYVVRRANDTWLLTDASRALLEPPSVP